jgi:hypothetical protein
MKIITKIMKEMPSPDRSPASPGYAPPGTVFSWNAFYAMAMTGRKIFPGTSAACVFSAEAMNKELADGESKVERAVRITMI